MCNAPIQETTQVRGRSESALTTKQNSTTTATKTTATKRDIKERGGVW